jgi:translocator protein
MNKWIRLIICVLACQTTGIIGSVFTMPSIPTWYASLEKPWFTPPNWVFGPVWITLFTLMGVSLYWILERKSDKRFKLAASIFAVQFALNIKWNFLFFGLQNPLYGFIDIIIMWAAIAAMIAIFYRISKKAGLVLLPYILWVSIATALNYYVMIMN